MGLRNDDPGKRTNLRRQQGIDDITRWERPPADLERPFGYLVEYRSQDTTR
jgi:hypothetical protein